MNNESSPNGPAHTVLIVDDDVVVRRLLATLLADAGYGCAEAGDAREAELLLEAQPFDAVVCDIGLPDESGIDLVRRVRREHPDIAAVMVTAADDQDTARAALEAGADGYVTKPFRGTDLVIALMTALRQRGVLARHADERRRLERASVQDRLTGLPQRAEAQSMLEAALGRAEAVGADVAVLLVNIDRFALINSALGHAAGDAVLVAVADRLREATGDDGQVARVAADEYLIVREDVRGSQGAIACAENKLAALRKPLAVAETSLSLTASVGVAVAAGGIGQPDSLVRDAGIALRSAKEAGGNVVRLFEAQMRERWRRRLSTEMQLRRALESEQFRLYYQPIVDLRDGELRGLEALLRWQHPEEGLVGPGRFVPIAEETGLIVELGSWVIGEACLQIARWNAAPDTEESPPVFVNVSAREFARPAFIDDVSATLKATNVAPQQLSFEITESQLIGSGAPSGAFQAARRLGIRLVLDDFGTGYSALGYLRQFPVQGLKIDRGFIAGLPDDPSSLALVHAILSMAASLEVEVVAEGIETTEQLGVVRSLNCRLGQGYVLARPMTASAVTRLLQEGHRWVDVIAAADSGSRGPAGLGHHQVDGRLPSSPQPDAGRGGPQPRLLRPADAAAALGVSRSTLRRWADAGQVPMVKTSGGHRRFNAADIRRLRRQLHGRAATVRPLLPPQDPLPRLAATVRARGGALAAATARHLYAGASTGWFAAEEGASALDSWLRSLATAADRGDYDLALEASRALMDDAYVHGTTLLERQRFVDSFREVTARVLAQHGASNDEVVATRRLFASLGQSLLES